MNTCTTCQQNPCTCTTCQRNATCTEHNAAAHVACRPTDCDACRTELMSHCTGECVTGVRSSAAEQFNAEHAFNPQTATTTFYNEACGTVDCNACEQCRLVRTRCADPTACCTQCAALRAQARQTCPGGCQ